MATAPKIDLQSDNPIVQQILAGTANPNILLMAAKGVLPIGTYELMHLLYVLAFHPDPKISKTARDTAWGLDESTTVPILSDPSTASQVLDAFARISLDKEAVLTAVVQNRATVPQTLTFLGDKISAPLLDIVVTNQTRLIGHPEIMEALLKNPRLTPDIERRLHEIKEEFFVKRKAEEERLRREEEERRRREEEERRARAAEPEPAPAERIVAEEVEEEKRRPSLAEPLSPQMLAELSVPEKIERAMKGSKADRAILVRDGSKVVREAVIASPKVGDAEVESYAAMRNIPEEILRVIGNNREWTKNYSVVLNLVRNPKCPIPISMNLIKRLNFRDLKILSTDKNIPEVIRRTAKGAVEKQHAGTSKKR